MFFFFQAEDGIRDSPVTGVQTCALPIYDMLGEKIGSMTGTATNSVLPSEGSLPKFTTSTENSGTLAGAEVQAMATYSATMREDGTLYGECPNQGVIMAQEIGRAHV